ncbi:MAG: cobaltochelatase subunit CobN [Synergistaceae bacterium]|jgi:cobaltochelatase CobN|nr:cobaltochelatase subunit CobN [Synergistaceae bacterium]
MPNRNQKHADNIIFARVLQFFLPLLFFILSAPFAAEGAANVSLLVIDSDSYVADAAISGLGLPEDFAVRSFCLSDLKENAGALDFIRGSSVLIVDVMDDELSRYVIENGLTGGRKIYAIRGSKDDSALVRQGFVFEPKIDDYYSHLNAENVRNMIKMALSLEGENIAFEPVRITPDDGLYHPDAGGEAEVKVFEAAREYLEWYESRDGYDPARPWLGMMYFSTTLLDGQRGAWDILIRKFESEGFNVLPAFGRDRVILDSFFLDEARRPRVDAVLSFSLKFYLSLDEKIARNIEYLDAPIFNAIELYTQTIGEWAASEAGIPPLDVVWTLATPEISGVIEPTPMTGKIEERSPSGGKRFHGEVIPDMAERIIPRIRNWIKLRKMANTGKKAAILYYNNSQGKQNIGASYLNVFRSIETVLDMMKESGFAISSDVPLDEDTIKGLILRGGRNIGAWAPGELDSLIESGMTIQLPMSEYKEWFAELPKDFRDKVIKQWGEPEEGAIMTKDGKIIIPMVQAGNVVLLPEPSRGSGDDPMKLYHDPTLYPHHQYIAAYLWLAKSFKADVMIHLGTHATYEWLPGKGAGLSASCPPEVMLTDIPNIYPYIMDNVGEGTQAKRRGRGVMLDHLTPALVEAEEYHEYADLAYACAQYENAASLASGTEEAYLNSVREIALRLGIDKDLGLDGIEDKDDVTAISQYLEYLETSHVPYGLHTFGISPTGDALNGTIEAILRQNPSLPRAEAERKLAESGPSEAENFIRALDGHYVPPAEGNDPVRNPAAIPTGKNFYGISPSRLPTPAAWALGQSAADGIIEKYIADRGIFPDKVAVVLWATESLRNEGLNEAAILSLIGVEPVWNAVGQVAGTRPIPGSRLGRPRVDVAIDISGLYRDLFPDKVLLIDAAIRQAAAQDDIENFISRNDARIKESLIKSGMSEEDAGRFSRARIFSEMPGAYGNRVSELTSASGLWEKDSQIADTFLRHTGYAYGADVWGAPAETALRENLRDAKAAWHSVSSNIYGALDNDDVFMYLGGMSLAIRNLSGIAPTTLIADQRTLGSVRMEGLQKFIGAEMRSRYLNPKWIEGMKAEKYAGAGEMSHYVEYLWGWQVTTPEAVDKTAWEQTYEVYVEDKYGLDMTKFLDENNPWAFQSMTGRMLEAIRKNYWDAPEEVKRRLAADYAASVINRGLACCDHTCNNPLFHQMVMNVISIPGLMSPELAAEFKLAVEKTGGDSIENMTKARENLLQNLGEQRPEAERSAADTQYETEDVKGFKMEPIQNEEQETLISSSGVEWFAALFVLVILALFGVGLRRGRREKKRG